MKINQIISTLCLFFLLCSVSGQDTLNRIDAQGKKMGYWKKYEKKKLIYEGRFDKDIPVGQFKYYHEDGSLKSVSDFLNGTHKVQSTLFHKNGQKSAEGLFIDQQKEGGWKYYSNSGKLIKEESYNSGRKHGVWKTYSTQTGTLLVEEVYDNGLLNGVRKEYYTGGDIRNIVPYVNGKRNGVGENYTIGNVLESRGMFHNNTLIGTWEFFDANGKPRKNVEYEKGIEKSRYIIFYNGSTPQKLNQTAILFVKKMGNGIELTTRNGNKLQFSDDFNEIKYWVDNLAIVQISPSIMVAYDAIKGYKEVEDDADEIIVFVEPAFDYEIRVRGDFALLVKSFYNTTIPVLEDER